MTYQRFEDLVGKDAIALAVKVYELTEKFGNSK